MKIFSRGISCLILTCLLNHSLTAQSWQQQVNYKIDVSLNDRNHTLDGYVKIDYFNNSPDTLKHIWIHLWPNAYKNDKTAFSDQMLENGRTDFYFSNNDKRGYINRLDFKVNGLAARFEDHPEHIDIGKLILPVFLPPGKSLQISTPFHIKLPHNFSRGGHVDQSYQITQWFPKAAVYDKTGWHEMPYLDQGEFYSNFGKYHVQITVPQSYIVTATGALQNDDERKRLLALAAAPKLRDQNTKTVAKKKTIGSNATKTTPKLSSAPDEPTKTLIYVQDSVHDFAWFADKTFEVNYGTTTLPSGKKIELWSFNRPSVSLVWKYSVTFLERAIQTRSKLLGDYPYAAVTAVEAPIGFTGGMEYPMITSISPLDDEESLEGTIEHEVGHNWNYGILATNERDAPWMDEGINAYYDQRYKEEYPDTVHHKKKGKIVITTGDDREFLYQHLIRTKADQPIESSSELFSESNYYAIAYHKAARWMRMLEEELGRTSFDSAMRTFYRRYSFKHPTASDLKATLEEVGGKNLDAQFALLSAKGPLPGDIRNRQLKLKPFISFKETDKYKYIFISPAVGYNFYDKVMIGGAIHNYTLPLNKFHFFIAPTIGTGSKEFAGIARLGYSWYPDKLFSKVEIAASAAKFNMDDFVDSTGKRNLLGVEKFVPTVRFDFKPRSARSTVTKYIQWKTFFFNEENLRFERDTIRQLDIITYPKISRYINQLKLVVQNHRALYPYRGELQLEQGKNFVRAAFEGKYHFNFANGGGVDLRFFAGKFFYTTDKTIFKQFETDRYHLNMTGPKGYEDYTYSNYFIGRSEFEKLPSQQIMIRDGGFKVRTDLLASKIGKTDDWLTAINISTNIPDNINPLSVMPIKIPIKVFVDVGTYAEAWKEETGSGRFVYDAGLQLSALKGLINVYAPLLYSKVYSDYFKSTITEKRFVRNISFSIDIQKINFESFIKKTFL
jgi:hypothetical protein